MTSWVFVKTFLGYLYYFFLRFILSLRYKIKVEGLEKLSEQFLKCPGGVLFLANHPAEVDPCILLSILWPKFRPHPIAIDYLFQNRFVRYFLDFAGALSVPHFEHGTNSYKKRKMEQTYERIYALLRNGENLLIYPSGGLKRQSEEVIGGASGAHTILQNCPEANVVLLRTRGLWGSSFSRAITGISPNLIQVGIERFKGVLKNLIFFSPRRTLTVVIDLPPPHFPSQGSRLELNRFLEDWFNQEGKEPLTLVPYYFWKKELPKAFETQISSEKIDLSSVPQDVINAVKEEVAALSGRSAGEIGGELYLAKDLGLDSLDLAQLVLFLKESFGINNIHGTDLVKVDDLFAFAAKLKKGRQENEIEEKKPEKAWGGEEKRPKTSPPQGNTIQEAFLHVSERMQDHIAAADFFSGEVSYKKVKLAVLLIAEKIKKLPDERIGIMMPASVTVNILILASLMAKKVPVMINWTLGRRNLQAIADETALKTVISSWGFLDRLENTDLNGFDDKITLVEEMVRTVSLKELVKAFLWRRYKPKTLLKKWGLEDVSEEDTAVILFTSGTESLPKGVPLSHRNILSNQRGGYERVAISEQDVLLGVLPPFHSFGFSITGLFPILSGLRAVYYPNPTDGKKIASIIDKWQVTILCIVPTFLKNLVRVASEQQMRPLRFVVTGAEKTPPDLYEKMGKLNGRTILGEGYGITECGPILTLNSYEKERKGVGKPLSEVEVLIVHPETHEILPQNKEGLIVAHGPNVFKGYLNPQLSSPFIQIGDKQWYVTGDLGFLNQEGYLTLSGRLKRFVKVGGEMISLASIEDILFQAAKKRDWKIEPEVASLAVCAKEEEGKKGEVHLFTIFDLTSEEANEVLKEAGMSNLIRIFQVHKLPFIPLLGTGKIDYKALSGQI